jgi:hypothetical protein
MREGRRTGEEKAELEMVKRMPLSLRHPSDTRVKEIKK